MARPVCIPTPFVPRRSGRALGLDMRWKRFIVTGVFATFAVLGLLLVAAVLSDVNFPDPPPRVCQYFSQFIFLIVAWPLFIYSWIAHGDPPRGLWWPLLAVAGLFWSGVGGVFLRVKNAKRP